MAQNSWYALGQEMAKYDQHYKCACKWCKLRAAHVKTIKAIKAEIKKDIEKDSLDNRE